MATEPISGFAAGLLLKAGATAGAGLLGAAAMAAFDPPKSRRELFLQAATAGTGSLVFGKLAVIAATKYVTFAPADELTIPVFFLVGAMSWGVFGALAKLRKLVAEKGAGKVAEKVGLGGQ